MRKAHTPKHAKKSKFSLHRLYPAAALLLLAAIGTSMWATGPLAKYITAASGSDGARVARFAVGAAPSAGQSDDLRLDIFGDTAAAYTFTVSNVGADGVNETATAYDVTVTFPSALKGVTLTLKNGETAVIGTASADNKTFTFANVGVFPAATAQTDTLTLTFSMAADAVNAVWDGIRIEVYAAQAS